MAAFATPEDLASFLQVPTVDRYTAELLLDLASAAVRDEVHQQIDRAISTETYDGLAPDHEWAHVVFLRQVPVIAINTVVDAGVTLLPTVDYVWSAFGTVTRVTGVFTDQPRGIAVTYDHGYDPGASALLTARAVCLQVAARAYVNPSQVEQLTVGGVSRSYARSDPRTGRVDLSEYERRRLDPLRR